MPSFRLVRRCFFVYLEAGGAGFLRRLADLRAVAARGLPEGAKLPTLVLPVDQAEELFTTVRSDRPGETSTAEASLILLRLAEVLRHGPEALALVTIRSDAYEPLQPPERWPACRRSRSTCRPSPRPTTTA